jgi:hypothetical protein
MFGKVSIVAASGIFAACLFAQDYEKTRQAKCDWEVVNFDFNDHVVTDAFPSLFRLAEKLQKHRDYRVLIEGNTDNIGSDNYNIKLGQKRADAVAKFLTDFGASPAQLTSKTRGKGNPENPDFKKTYGKTDRARWMNRRVVLTVTDASGNPVTECTTEPVPLPPQPPKNTDCCDKVEADLQRLAKLLEQLINEHQALNGRIGDLDSKYGKEVADIKDLIKNMPKPIPPPTAEEVATAVEKRQPPRFSLLGLNVGADGNGQVTFTGAGRYFAPFKEHFAVQAQGEYLYTHGQKEGQFDIGLVNRINRFQGSLFASFKHVNLQGYGAGGTLGQGSAVFEYLFSRGKVGVFGTKGFMDNAILDQRQVTLPDGSLAPNLYVERFLHITDQAGVNGTLALWGNNYLEGNIGYLRAYSTGDRVGGTVRFIFPLFGRFALTAEGGVNETMIGQRGNNGRAVFGIQWGNLLRPKEFLDSKYAVPVQVPRVRYEVVSRNIMKGSSPPVADAGPDQIGIPAGTVTLNGSNSHDPNGLALTFRWIQETGPSVALSSPTSAITNFTAGTGQAYTFRLTVTNTVGLSASARVRVTTRADLAVQILFFNANPTTIQTGQASQLSYRVLNATSVTISGIGNVNPANGNLPVSPTVTTTYVLTAKNDTSQESATATVTVMNPQAQIQACTATPMNIMAGESATIIYATLNATTVTISPGVGNVGASGSIVVTPAVTTNYVITASNATSNVTCNVTVAVTPGTAPRIIRFTANPLTIVKGATSTLVWQVENADTVTIVPNLNTVPLIGTQDVSPAQTTSYTLTATNKFGQATAQATVTVTQPPPPPPPNVSITSFTANPPVSPSPGSPVVLTCIATNATSVSINGVGPVNANGQVTVNPQTTTTYTCTALGNGPPATATVTVTVTPPPPPPPPPVIVIGGLNGLQCSATVVPAGGGASVGGATFTCQTVVRQVQLDLSQSTSPAGNAPLTFLTTARNTNSAVLNPTAAQPIVQLGELFGDYLFDVLVTDAKGNQAAAIVDIQLVVTRPPQGAPRSRR